MTCNTPVDLQRIASIDRLIDLGEYRTAVFEADKLLSGGSDSALAWMQKVSALYFAGDVAQALSLMPTAIEASTADQAALMIIGSYHGYALLASNRIVEAEAAFRQSLGANAVSALCGLAESATHVRDWKSAKLHADTGCRNAPEFYRAGEPDGYARLLAVNAWIYQRLGRKAKAAAFAAEAAATTTGQCRPLAAWACFFLGLAEGARHFELGANLDPNGFWGGRCARALDHTLPGWAA